MVTADLIIVAPLVVLALVGIMLPLMGGTRLNPKFGTFTRGSLATFALLALVVSGFLAAATVFDVPGLGVFREAAEETGGVAFVLYETGPFTVFFQLVFLAVAALVVVGSPSYITTSRHQGEYYALLVLATLGMMVVAGARDLVTLFVGFELASFSTFALAGWFKDAPDSTEAALKYFIIGALSSALTLFGISLIYGLAGGTDFERLADVMASAVDTATARDDPLSPLVIFAWGFLFAGFGFKIALVPFHNWAPDVYDGSPSTVSAFLAAGSKKMGFAALFKVFLIGLIALKANWLWITGVIAIVTMTVGNVAALRQDNVKRMLAYSSIAQAGYMLIALPIATQYALAGSVFQIFTHGFMKTGAFLVVAAFATFGVGEMLRDWRGVGRKAPFVGLAMAIFLLSLAGIPPLAGFMSKFVLFSAAIDAGGWFVWLAIFGILNSAISIYYYARVVRVMYMSEEDATGAPVESVGVRVPFGVTLGIFLALVATVGIGLWPDPFIDFSLEAAAAIVP